LRSHFVILCTFNNSLKSHSASTSTDTASTTVATTSTSTATTSDAVDSHLTNHDSANNKVLATPTVRRLAREHQLDLSQVVASGREGRILKGDVLAHLSGATVTKVSSNQNQLKQQQQQQQQPQHAQQQQQPQQPQQQQLRQPNVVQSTLADRRVSVSQIIHLFNIFC
jgi:pyruvate/2-oxoglutarate dehydrogenase complex dihydrolipoamide acyltransferase (E2) component